MLYLTRKVGESIIINNNIEIIVTEVNKNNVKLGMSFPSNVTILRKEIHDKIAAENITAGNKNNKSISDLTNLNYKNISNQDE